MWLESAGGGLRVAWAGKWLAAMSPAEVDHADPERRLFAEMMWEYRFGDRHTAMTVLACGADRAEITRVLTGRCSPTGRWPGHRIGRPTTTRSATGMKTRATRRRMNPGSSPGTSTKENWNEIRHSPRLPPGGLRGRDHRHPLSHAIHLDQLSQH
ncbi:putative cobalamin synthesis CobW domain-containing protein [Mycobacterium ulcerans str. Harvey]|uniref:Cobalamin synthesis CobW domain-containing protein n=1 Tax=Mycobacterium ulcerans str. Harvey TaxID=1299332 RepID=A0ABN0QM87_MYCUL|nr:putative cobalamin synthesis CobW domain-containing protein [Mycobacterium ulcerans str. Harvey]